MGLWDRLTSITPPRPTPGAPLYRLAVQLGRLNTWLYRRTNGRLGGTMGGAPVCILHHRGAKSGAARQSPVLYLRDGDNMILAASMGGSPKHPSWYHNLCAHPDVELEFGDRRQPVRARVADDDERDRLWPRLVGMYSNYAEYQARADRKIPVIVCEPRSP